MKPKQKAIHPHCLGLIPDGIRCSLGVYNRKTGIHKTYDQQDRPVESKVR